MVVAKNGAGWCGSGRTSCGSHVQPSTQVMRAVPAVPSHSFTHRSTHSSNHKFQSQLQLQSQLQSQLLAQFQLLFRSQLQFQLHTQLSEFRARCLLVVEEASAGSTASGLRHKGSGLRY